MICPGDWSWPNASIPSTHILKPGDPAIRGIEVAEAAAIDLASRVGIPAPQAEVSSFAEQTAFVIDRFDRIDTDGPLASRLHAEDFAQALSVPPARKYEVSAEQSMRLLQPVDPTGDIRRAFLKQLAFNVILGNADAHAKNYSLLLRPESVALAPIYDVVPLSLYPQFEQKLAMKIGGARFAREVSPSHWRKFAQKVGLDVDETLSLVREVASRVAASNDEVWMPLEEDQRNVLTQYVARNVERLLAN
ncbi:HipA domain-containing protein [Gulosibacter chungangensis]|uniref:HipA domain-containing protein n=1 Tax=Gulosibacter chungangensis TaxID=979746 RepID=UPI0017882F5C|nr:HipA domain-containing protein [Gulosibacter chungangensis]